GARRPQLRQRLVELLAVAHAIERVGVPADGGDSGLAGRAKEEVTQPGEGCPKLTGEGAWRLVQHFGEAQRIVVAVDRLSTVGHGPRGKAAVRAVAVARDPARPVGQAREPARLVK